MAWRILAPGVFHHKSVPPTQMTDEHHLLCTTADKDTHSSSAVRCLILCPAVVSSISSFEQRRFSSSQHIGVLTRQTYSRRSIYLRNISPVSPKEDDVHF